MEFGVFASNPGRAAEEPFMCGSVKLCGDV
jgi:hypothetical protein